MNRELKQAQSIMYEMLIAVDRVCVEHTIDYWLDGGTLLGAVREKGFIAWDDDLDVCMTVEDFYKFCEVAQGSLPKDMFLQTTKTDKTYPYDYAKIRSEKAKMVEKHEIDKCVAYHQGVYMDIFPMITIKKNLYSPFARKLTYMFIKLFSYKYLNISVVRRALIKFVGSFHAGWKNGDDVVIYSGHIPNLAFAIKVSDLYPLQRIGFEEGEFLAPHSPQSYLTTLYGKDYMQPPKLDERHTHAHVIELDKK
jgi:lipopolysaccharide cholinephosphotransferase